MILAAYMVAGFLVASVYAVGMLRGRRDRLHRLGFLIPFTRRGRGATPVQLYVGDVAARAIAEDQPAKFAAMEYVTKTGPNQPEYVGGIYVDGEVKGAIEIPDLDSFLVGFSADTVVTGLERHPGRRASRPPPRCCTSPSTRWWGSAPGWPCWPPGSRSHGGGDATFRARRGSCARRRSRGWRAIVAMECGWIVTEVGPPAVGGLRAPAHRGRRDRRRRHLVHVRRGGGAVRRARSGDGARAACDVASLAGGGARRRRSVRAALRSRTGRCDVSETVAVVLWVGLTFYAVLRRSGLRRGVLGSDRRRRRARRARRAR